MSHHSSDPDRLRTDEPPPVAPRRSAGETAKQTIAGLSALTIMFLLATPLVLCLLLAALLIFWR